MTRSILKKFQTWWSISKNPPLRSVLFVCTANITRSPTAEALFRKEMTSRGEDWKIASAGVKAAKGMPSHEVISYIMHSRGVPVSNHHSQPVTEKLLHSYYWIIVMETVHKEAILKIIPDLNDRLFTFRELAGNKSEDFNMPDPTGTDINGFTEFFNIIDKEMPLFVKALLLKVEDALWEYEESKIDENS